MDRERIIVPGMALLAMLLISLDSPAWQEPAMDMVQGRGAAGVTEVGRPLDVLRARAERKARQRALDELISNVLDTRGQDLTQKQRKSLTARVEDVAGSKEALWQTSYWTNGAVTTTVLIRISDLGPPGKVHEKEEK